jgi:hypothetical protein
MAGLKSFWRSNHQTHTHKTDRGPFPGWLEPSRGAVSVKGLRPLQTGRTQRVVTKIEWFNPHAYFYIDVTDKDGKVVNWGCETANPGSLLRSGWKRDDLKVGDRVTVDGYLAKDGSHLADARLIFLLDGRRIFGGTPGEGGPGDPENKTPAK